MLANSALAVAPSYANQESPSGCFRLGPWLKQRRGSGDQTSAASVEDLWTMSMEDRR